MDNSYIQLPNDLIYYIHFRQYSKPEERQVQKSRKSKKNYAEHLGKTICISSNHVKKPALF